MKQCDEWENFAVQSKLWYIFHNYLHTNQLSTHTNKAYVLHRNYIVNEIIILLTNK